MKYGKLKRLMAGVLCCGMLFSQLGVVNAADTAQDAQSVAEVQQVAETDDAEAAEQAGNAEAADSQVENAGEQLQENSWRYAEGELIESEVSAYSITSPDRVKPENAVAVGIDVSYHNKTIDWQKVKNAGVDYVIIRCGYGDDDPSQDDTKWLENVKECERLGIPYGVYLYSYATTVEGAKSEADHTLRLLKGHNPTYPVYYDLEDNSTLGSDFDALATTFCSKITEAGYSAGVYASKSWWDKYLTSSIYDQWARWVARYNTYCGYTKTYSMWQYTSLGKVDGIEGYVDLNYWLSGKAPTTSAVDVTEIFGDVSSEDWYKESVDYVYQKGFMTGMDASTFGPNEILSRAQFVTVLYRIEGEPSVAGGQLPAGVPADQWYSNAVIWANANGIMTGYDNGEFGIPDEITREQLVTMMHRYAVKKEYDGGNVSDLKTFADKDSVSGFALQAVQWAVGNGIISGEGDTGLLNPAGSANRSHCAKIITQFMKLTETK